jgi:hypothetical protein
MGRVWAEKNADLSTIANVALYGEGWPTTFVETARRVANEEGDEISKSNAAWSEFGTTRSHEADPELVEAIESGELDPDIT